MVSIVQFRPYIFNFLQIRIFWYFSPKRKLKRYLHQEINMNPQIVVDGTGRIINIHDIELKPIEQAPPRYGIAIGDGARADEDGIAIGHGARADNGGIAIGPNVIAGKDDIIIGDIDIREMYNMVRAMWDAPGMPGANAVLAELETDLAEDGN